MTTDSKVKEASNFILVHIKKKIREKLRFCHSPSKQHLYNHLSDVLIRQN